MAGQGKRTRWLATAATAIGLAAALGLAAPAHADTLGIQTLGCIPQGASLMECFVAVTGGTAPYAYQWNATAVNSNDVVFRCSTAFPSTGTATVTVIDSAGDSVSGSRGYTCVGGMER